MDPGLTPPGFAMSPHFGGSGKWVVPWDPGLTPPGFMMWPHFGAQNTSVPINESGMKALALQDRLFTTPPPACTVGISPEGHDERPGTHPSRSGHAARIIGLAARTKIVGPPSRARSEESMQRRINRDLLAMAALWTGVLIPLLYFGNQFVAATFYPGYSFLSQDASTLGSADSRWPELFNIGSVVTGVLCGFTAFGFLHDLSATASIRPSPGQLPSP